ERQLSEPIPARVRFTIPVLDRADPAAELIAVRLVDREHRSWHAVDLVLHALQRDRLVAVVVFLLDVVQADYARILFPTEVIQPLQPTVEAARLIQLALTLDDQVRYVADDHERRIVAV